MSDSLLDRPAFKAAVFARDNHACVICGAPADAAHHILERKLFRDGGYYLSNGASLCPDCHYEAEKTTLSVEEVRAACRINNPALPPGFSAKAAYDKWGNEIHSDGTRSRGPLFNDPGARKILTEAGILYDGTFGFG
ncbi:HNH endonuclease [Leisingera sp. XS_AS12]|uniref:HNH endonuclease n=1 Tax=Leisingera sp. XS_AS12 TaxID=3241294 RepID=UPI0035125EDF